MRMGVESIPATNAQTRELEEVSSSQLQSPKWKQTLQYIYKVITTDPDDSSDEDDEDDEDEADGSISPWLILKDLGHLDRLILVGAVLSSVFLGTNSFVWVYLFIHVSNVMTHFWDTVHEGNVSISEEEKNTAEENYYSEIHFTLMVFVSLSMVYFVLGFCRVYFWSMFSERTVHKIRRQFYSAAIHSPMEWHDKNTSGKIVSQLSDDIAMIQTALSDTVGQLVEGIAGLVFGLGFSFYLCFHYSLVITMVFSVLMYGGIIFYRVVARLISKGSDYNIKATEGASEVLSAIRTVKSFSGEQKAVEEYASNLRKGKRATVQSGFMIGLESGFTSFYSSAVYAFGIYYGYELLKTGAYDGSNIMNALLTIFLGSEKVFDRLELLGDLHGSKRAICRVISTINEATASLEAFKSEHKARSAEKVDIKGSIEFKNVTFAYPARKEVDVLRDVSLSVNEGQMVALVGSSGSGKSTIVNLLLQFYQPQEGEILVDGQSLSALDQRTLLNQIGIVSQEPVLFSGTVMENVCWGAATIAGDSEVEVSMEKVVEVCKLANIHDVISSLPKGYETFVGEGGCQFSGGQKQRIAIARSLLRNPKILLFDEATSALDTKSERLVQKAIESCVVSRTTIVIAHRLSTVKKADKIVVMHKGKIVEVGTHQSLIQNSPSGHYASLVKAQTLVEGVESSTDDDSAEEEVELKDDQGESDLTVKEENSTSTIHGKEEVSSSEGTIVAFIASFLPSFLLDSLSSVSDSASVMSIFYQMYRVFKYTKPSIVVTSIALLSSVFNGALLPIFGDATSAIVSVFNSNKLTEKEDSTIQYWVWVFISLSVADFVAPIIRRTGYALVGADLSRKLRVDCFQEVLYQPVEYFNKEDNSSGAILSRLSSQASSIQGVVGGSRMGLIVQGIGGFGIAVVISFMNVYPLAILTLFLVPMLCVGVFWELEALDDLVDETKKFHEDSCQLATETLQQVRTVHMLGRQETFNTKFSKESENAYSSSMKIARVAAAGVAFKESSEFLVYAITFWFGSGYVLQGTYTPEQVICALYTVVYSSQAVGWMYYALPEFVSMKSASIAIFELIDAARSKNNGQGIEDLVKFQGIEAQNVSFSYPSREDIKVLDGIDLGVMEGKTVALVGSSGCGKSTFLSLLMRFYDPETGRFLLNGKYYSSFASDEAIRSVMSCVSQEPTLFSTTIKGNVAYGRLNAQVTDEEIVNACKLANAHEFIMELPKQYDTEVGERGAQLSGGQKQRIAIARAMLRDPKLLLLDEATSALDSESERIVQNALNKAMENRTVLVIAHRLSTIQNADIIAVFHEGKVVELGNHSELLQKDGIYKSLVQQQQLSE